MSPSIEFLGAYKVEMTKSLFKETWEAKYGGLKLSRKQKKQSEQYLREELSSIVLIEVLVKDYDQEFNVGHFMQQDTDQVAYDEGFLTTDGTELISRFRQPEDAELRIAFYLHFFNPSKSIKTSYGEFMVNKIDDMPSRLSELVPYRPVD